LNCIPEALQAKVGTSSLEAQTKLEKETAKKEAKAEAKADAALKKKMVRPVYMLTWDCIEIPISPYRHHKYATIYLTRGIFTNLL
jgi:hypothetical protein